MKLLRHLVKRGARAQPGWVLLPVFGYFVLTSAYLNAFLECVQQLLCADVNAEHSGGGGANASWAVGCNDAEVTARTAHVGSIMTLAYSVPTIVSVGVVGLIADSRGRKVGLVVANASQALASCAVLAVLLLRAVMGRAAVSVWWLLVSAICGALGGGYPVFLSSAFSYTADTSRRARRGASFALLEGAAFAGFIVGPLIFGELTKNVESGYEWFFTIHALGSALIAGFCALIPESMRSESAQNNASGALVEPLLAVGQEESASAAAAAAAAAAAVPASASAPPGLGGMVTNGIKQPTAAELSRSLRERAAPIGATMTPWSDVEWCDANVISSLYITVAAHGEKRTRWGLAVVGVAFALQYSATIGLMYVGIVFTSQVFHWDDGTIGAWSSARAVVSAVAAVGAAAALRCCAGCEEHAARRNLSGHRWHSEGRSRGGGSACFDERESFGDEKREGGFTMPYNNLDASFAAADRPFFDGPTSPSRTLSMSRQSFDGSSAGTPTTQERLRSNTLSSINSAEMMPRDHEFGGGKMFFCCCSAPIRNRCCDALVRLRGCTRCPGHWGRTIGAAPGEVGANELCTARIAVAVGTLGFFLAALTPKLVDSVTLFWVATLLASVQQMAMPCLRAVFSACANDALQGQALGAIAALEVFVASVASPALQSIFRQSAAVDRPLSAPKGSTPWQAFEAFVEGAAIGPSSVLYVCALLSAISLALLLCVTPRALRKDTRDVEALGRRAISLRAALAEQIANSQSLLDDRDFSIGGTAYGSTAAEGVAAGGFYKHRHGGLSALDLARMQRSREASHSSQGGGSPTSSEDLMRRRHEGTEERERRAEQTNLKSRFTAYELAHERARAALKEQAEREGGSGRQLINLPLYWVRQPPPKLGSATSNALKRRQ